MRCPSALLESFSVQRNILACWDSDIKIQYLTIRVNTVDQFALKIIQTVMCFLAGGGQNQLSRILTT